MVSLKKLVALGATVLTMSAMTVTTFAAGISSSEQKVLDALKGHVSADLYNQAESYLAANDITDESAAKVVAEVNAAVKTAGTEGVIDSAKLSADQKTAIKANVTTAANAVDLVATFDNGTAVVQDKAGKAVLTTNGNDVIKTTGVNPVATMSVIAAIAAVMCGCASFVFKKRA